MIRVALAIAWREARLVAYRSAALSALTQRHPALIGYGCADNRFTAEQRAEIAADAERLARAMLDAEGTR